MIEISRALARRFRAVLRQALASPRGDAPLVLCRAGPEGLTLEARRDDVAVRHHESGDRTPDAVAFRASVLAEFEGRTDEPVTIEQVAFGKGRARWNDGGVPRVIEFETVAPDSVPPFPDVPKRFTAQPTELLHALDEAARTTARESVRLALARVQIRGRNGEVIATDGRQLLVQGGFHFPWQEDLLVPRVLAFGSRDLDAQDQPVGVGRTDSHLAVRVGPWLFLLVIDAHSRFPDTQAVIPRPNSARSRLRFDPDDATFLAGLLPKLPGRDGQHEPITLDLDQAPAVRARADDSGPATEVVLARSTASGPPVRLCTDRRYLFRALKLGFREVQVGGADRPLACRDGPHVYVWMPLEKEGTIPPGPDLLRLSSADSKPTVPAFPPEAPVPRRRRTPMPTPTSKSSQSENGSTGPPDRCIDSAELIEEVEALRAALIDATSRATHLLAGLKQQRRQSRALKAAVATLRQLRLGP